MQARVYFLQVKYFFLLILLQSLRQSEAVLTRHALMQPKEKSTYHGCIPPNSRVCVTSLTFDDFQRHRAKQKCWTWMNNLLFGRYCTSSARVSRSGSFRRHGSIEKKNKHIMCIFDLSRVPSFLSSLFALFAFSQLSILFSSLLFTIVYSTLPVAQNGGSSENRWLRKQ